MRFTSPLFFLLLIPIAIGLFLSFKQVQGLARKRKRNAFILRGLLSLSLVLALTGPEIYKQNKGICTVFVIDRSDSINDEQRTRQEDFVARATDSMSYDDVSGVVVFGANASIESAPSGRRAVRGIESRIDASNSDLAGAVRLASAIFPEGKAKRLVVLSDGNETQGDARAAAQVAANDNISIDYVSLSPPKNTSEALVSSIETPDSGKEGQPFDLRIQIESRGIRSGILRIDRDGVVIKQMPVSLVEGTNSIIVPQTVDSVGLVRYRAILQANGDADQRNNVGAGFVNVRGRPKILVAQQNLKDKSLALSLQKSGIAVDLVAPTSLPTRPEEYQSYDSIILNDINAANVPLTIQNAIVTASKDSGIGLAMIGGEDSFLPGGWYGSPVTDALPVDLNIRQKKSVAAASVFILADCSGSMGAVEDGQPKIRLASRAAEETIKMLGPMDRVGVAGSSNGIEIVVPMQSAADKESAITGARKLAVTGGGIYIRPSISTALEVLSKEPSKTRHFVLLADGADSTDWDTVFDTALAMRAQKITTSVVAIGDGKDVPNLKKLALVGGGRFYLALKAAQLPAIFTQDTAVMSRSAIEEGAFLPKLVQSDDSVRGVFDGGVPPLLAYCLAEAKPLTKTILKTKKDDLLYVTGRNGLASTFAFTSDAKARWAERWVPWEGFNTFWTQAIRAIGRQAPRNNYEVRVTQDGGMAKVTVTGRDLNGLALNAPETPIRIGSPDGKSQELNLSQIAPGKYEGNFSVSDVGSYIVSVVEPDGKGGAKVQASGVSIAYPAEYRMTRLNTPLLAEVAKATKGKELLKPEEIRRTVELQGRSMTELWPYFLIFALLALPIDIAVRRIVVPIKELFRKKKPTQKAALETSMGRLKTAKKSAAAKVERQPADASKPTGKPTVQPKVRPTSTLGQAVPTIEPEVHEEAIPGSAGSTLLASKKKRQEKD